MGEIVNLNRARKARDKAAGKVEAAQNRVVHGLTKAERSEVEAEAERRAHALDGARRERPDDDDPEPAA